jgi:uncharacterized protein (TIGR03118 family)
MKGLLRNLRKMVSTAPSRRTGRRPSAAYSPSLEYLEGRCLMSGNVLQTNLVSDLPGVAQTLDPNLVNPWGIATGPGGPFWISDNNSGQSTLYDTNGNIQGLVVSIPTPGDPLGASGTPTGTVFNIGPASSFEVSGFNAAGMASAKSLFLFATEDGTIVGWNPGVNPVANAAKPGTYGIIAKDQSGNNFTEPDPTKQTGAVFKGMAIANGTVTASNPAGLIFSGDTNSQSVVYVTNFRAGTVEAFDTKFSQITLTGGAFTDPNLPAGYAPFNIQVLNGKVYVTYALQNATAHDDVAGAHHGFVDVYNLDGSGEQRLISGGQLDSPWGLAIAPSSFGNLSGALLVGNFGNGHINAYNASNGTFLGELKDPDGEPIAIDGLWALRVGTGGKGGDPNQVYFTAGLFGETHGLFGSLASVAPGTPEGAAEEQMVRGDLDVFEMNATTVLNDVESGAPAATLNQDVMALEASFRQLAQDEFHLIHDELRDGNHAAARTHFHELHAAEDLNESVLDLVQLAH